MASRGVTTAGEKKALTAAQVRESYHRRLDIHINEALDAYRSIVASCKIQDRVEGLRGDFQSQVDSSNLCKAAEDILRLISELKVAAIAQDIADTKNEVRELKTIYESEIKFTERIIANMSENILPTLEALEDHYYRSCTTWLKKSNENSDLDDNAGDNDDNLKQVTDNQNQNPATQQQQTQKQIQLGNALDASMGDV